MHESGLVLGLQKGSLNDAGTEYKPGREGYTAQRLYGAGFVFEGYEPGGGKAGETIEFKNFDKIEGRVGSSQDTPGDLYEGHIDASISGDDWMGEFKERGKGNIKVIGLDFSKARQVVAATKAYLEEIGDNDFFEYGFGKATAELPWVIATEMPFLTRRFVMGLNQYKKAFGDKKPVMKTDIGITNGYGDLEINNLVVVKHVTGGAEGKLKSNVNCIMDLTQSGSSLEAVGAEVVAEVMKTQAGLFASPQTYEDPGKMRIVNYLVWMMSDGRRRKDPYGLNEHMAVDLNVKNSDIEKVADFIAENEYCDKGPSISNVRTDDLSSLRTDLRIEDWPNFAYGIYCINEDSESKGGGKTVTDIITTPVLMRLP